MRSCLTATALARQHGLDEDEVRNTFYTPLLMHVGCRAGARAGPRVVERVPGDGYSTSVTSNPSSPGTTSPACPISASTRAT